MLLIPVLLPVMLGLVLLAVVIVALGTVLFSAAVTAAVTAGSSMVATSRRRRAHAVATVTPLPETGVSDDMPLAA